MTGPRGTPLDLKAIEVDAAILDEPQLKRLGGMILSLDLTYVAAVQYAPEHMRALLAYVRALRAALAANICTCGIGRDPAAVLAQAKDE